jgi:hypothetical protein
MQRSVPRATHLDILAKPRGVIITCSLCITERFQDGISSQNLALYFA